MLVHMVKCAQPIYPKVPPGTQSIFFITGETMHLQQHQIINRCEQELHYYEIETINQAEERFQA